MLSNPLSKTETQTPAETPQSLRVTGKGASRVAVKATDNKAVSEPDPREPAPKKAEEAVGLAVTKNPHRLSTMSPQDPLI